jgi:hypothetical protein
MSPRTKILLPPPYAFFLCHDFTQPTSTPLKELQALSKRWRELAPRWPQSGALNELSQADLEKWTALERDLLKWGRTNGRIVVAAGLPTDPLEAILQAVLNKRRALRVLRRERLPNIGLQSIIDEILELWRQRLPNNAPPVIQPPARPGFRTWHETQAALDVFQREVERLQGKSPTPNDLPENPADSQPLPTVPVGVAGALPAREQPPLALANTFEVEKVTTQEAAVLKVLLQDPNVRQTAAQVSEKLRLSQQSIVDYLQELQRRNLVTPAVGKSGRSLTAAGLALAKTLSEDAGAMYFRNAR